MTTPAILAGTIPITLSAPARHAGGGKEALEVSASHRSYPGATMTVLTTAYQIW
jgi:hypothetical protein